MSIEAKMIFNRWFLSILLIISSFVFVYPELNAAETIFYDDFSDGNMDGWSLGDSNAANGSDYWGISYDGLYAPQPWCAMNSDGGATIWQNYDNNMYAYMRRSINLSDYKNCYLQFDYYLAAEPCCDPLLVKINGNIVWQRNGFHNWDGATPEIIDLSAYDGQNVSIEFVFFSDLSINSTEWEGDGAYVDNIGVYGTPLKPDLIARNLSISESDNTVWPGDSITVYFNIKNQGDVLAGGSWQGIMLSTNDFISGSDNELASEYTGPLLAGSDTNETNYSVEIPTGISGRRFIGILVDKNDDVDESEESNNNTEYLAIDIPVWEKSQWVNNQGCYVGGPLVPSPFVARGSGNLDERQATQDQMEYWNLYASVFAPTNLNTGLGAPGNGINEVNTFISTQEASSIYGYNFSPNTYGVAIIQPKSAFGTFNECNDFSSGHGDTFPEIDVLINADFSSGWTTDPNNYNDALVQTTALHEIGHTLGLHHVFSLPNYGDSFSVMNYINDDSGRFITRMDANTIRAHYHDRVQSVVDVGIFPFIFGNSDYAETYASVSPHIVERDDIIDISNFLVQNIGTQSASNVVITFYLSLDTTITDSDIPVATRSYSSLPVDADYDQNFSFPVPNTVQSGDYYIGAIVTVNGTEDTIDINNTFVIGRPNRDIVTVIGDTIPPSPNPMTWSTEPYTNSATTISMVAITATDSSTPVSYFFEFVGSLTGGAGGSDGGPQTATAYTDTGLEPNHQYSYRVKAQDSAIPPNETDYSQTINRYTLAVDPQTDSFQDITQNSLQANWSRNGNRIGTEYICRNVTTGENSPWTTDTYWVNQGLQCGTSYTFWVKARNGDGIETGWTVLGTQSTLSCFSPGILSVTPSEGLTSSGNQGGPFSPANKVYTITNNGESPINWTASKSANWISISNTGGALSSGESATVTIQINSQANNMSPGSYNDIVYFTNTTNHNGDSSRSVSLTINALPGILQVSPSNGLTSSGAQGGPFSPSTISYILENTGGSTISWTASNGQPWVSLSSTSGTLGSGQSISVIVSINTNANSLLVGDYNDNVDFINTTNNNGDTTRAVSLNVTQLGVAVSGIVYYSTNPLSGVLVELIQGSPTNPPDYTTTTSPSGNYVFTNVQNGTYHLKAYGPTDEYIGWFARVITVQGVDLDENIYLPKKLTLIEPQHNTTISNASPQFCWDMLPEAENYSFQLNKTSDGTLIDSVYNITTNCFTTSKTLQNGVQYIWQIDAFDQFQHKVGTTFLAFNFTVDFNDNDFYVAPPPIGNDVNNDGRSPEFPFATIQNAINVSTGSFNKPVIIHVAAGTYSENIEMEDWEAIEGGWNSGFTQRWDFENDGIVPPIEFETIIDGMGAGDVIVASSNSSISGFTIINAGNNSGIRSESNNLIIKFNKFTGSMGAGISIGLGGSATIESNFIFNLDVANSVGIDFGTAEALTPISKNLIVGIKGDGIRAGLSVINHIINNTIYGNDGWGIFLFGVSSNVKNNIIAQNSGGINLQGAGSTVAFNCVWNNSISGDYNFTPTPGTGEINEDPLFVDPDGPDNILGNEDDNFHLGYGSPCVNAGTSDGVNPDGSTDMGAYPSVIIGTTDWAGRACDFTNIQDGIDQIDFLGTGGSVLVTQGSYVQNVTIHAGIDLIGAGAESTIIDGGGTGDILLAWGRNLIRGFTFQNCGTQGPDVGISSVGNDINIENNKIVDVRTGIWLYGNNTVIRNNLILVNFDSGIVVGPISELFPALHPVIINNTIDGMGKIGSTGIVCATNDSSPPIINNIISNFGSQGIYSTSHNNLNEIKNNCFWNNTQNFYGIADQTGSNGNIIGDPQFADEGSENYHLTAYSECIDAATSDGAPDKDLEGNGRYDNPNTPNTGSGSIPYYDIGAYEYRPAIGDMNGDGDIDGLDLADFIYAFANGYLEADLNNDLFINDLDVKSFASSYGMNIGP